MDKIRSRRRWLTAGALLGLALSLAGGAAVAATQAPFDGPGPSPLMSAASPSTCTKWTSSTTPPNTIRVLIHSGSTAVRVDTIAFKTYVQNVLPNEWVSGWPAASLQAGAVAAKQYAWYYTMNSGHGGTFSGSCYDVTDTTASQVYKAGTAAATTNAAIDATWGVTLTKSNALFPTSYQATLTGNTSEACGAGLARYPNTMSQQGSRTCANAGNNFDAILSIYYPGSKYVQSGAGTFADMARTKSGTGYYLLTRDGAIHAHGTAPLFGDAKGKDYFLNQTAVGMATTPSGSGYWIVSASGGVYAYGDAQSKGSAAGQSYFINQTAVGMERSSTNGGYWIVSASGGIYSYGDAQSYGAAAGMDYFVNQVAVGMKRSASGNGYWIVSASGGIYSYGDAPSKGSAAGQSYFANQRAAGMEIDASGNGYWILSVAGGIYSFGDAPFFTSAAGKDYFANQSATHLVRSASGNGYWIAAVSGGVYSFGDAPFYGAA